MKDFNSKVTVYRQQSTPVRGQFKGFLNTHEFATICRTTPRTIRFYDKKDILKPATIDPKNGYRYYHPHQARDFFRIRLFQTFGVELRDMDQITDKASEDIFLNNKLDEIAAEIEEKQKQYKGLKRIKEDLVDEKMEQHVTVKDIGPFNLFGKQFEDARYDRINKDIVSLYKKAEELGLKTEPPEHVLYLEPHEYGPHHTRLQISLIVRHLPKEVPSGYYAKVFPKGKYLVYVYRGPYEYLTFVHRELYRIAKSKGYKDGYPFDMHPKGPLNTKSQYDYESIVCYPLE